MIFIYWFFASLITAGIMCIVMDDMDEVKEHFNWFIMFAVFFPVGLIFSAEMEIKRIIRHFK